MSLLANKGRKKAVAYYRHSAEDKQENSVPLQRAFVRDLLQKENVELIHEEADEGVSGLIADRPALQRLFRDWVLNENATKFDYVVVFDVSRWGRFEDSDEAGYYEFQCKQMGKEVIYARRGFPTKQEKGMSQVQTAFERWMSFKYSEKLSEDVIQGCINISKQGYSVGGQAPYGLARMLLSDEDKRKPIRIMQPGERKSVANERITFVPRGDQTTETVKDIFEYFLEDNLDPTEIAKTLNDRGIVSSNGGGWNRSKVYRILCNPSYKGTLIYNKNWGRLKRKKRRNPISDWVVYNNAFQAIVDSDRYNLAQERLHWLIPSRYLKGLYLLRKTKKVIRKDIRLVLKQNGVDPDCSVAVPVSVAVTRHMSDLTPYWCFLISRKMEVYKEILCIGIDMDRNGSIDRVFVVPTKAFTLTGMCLFSVNDTCYSGWSKHESEIESTVISYVEECANH